MKPRGLQLRRYLIDRQSRALIMCGCSRELHRRRAGAAGLSRRWTGRSRWRRRQRGLGERGERTVRPTIWSRRTAATRFLLRAAWCAQADPRGPGRGTSRRGCGRCRLCLEHTPRHHGRYSPVTMVNWGIRLQLMLGASCLLERRRGDQGDGLCDGRSSSVGGAGQGAEGGPH